VEGKGKRGSEERTRFYRQRGRTRLTTGEVPGIRKRNTKPPSAKEADYP